MGKSKAKGQSRSDSEIAVRSYHELRDYLKAFANRNLDFLILLGNGGVGKTQSTEKYVPDAQFVGTKLTAYDLYCKLYDNRDCTIVIDDIPDLFRNADTLALLKSLTDTRKVKTVSWNTASTGTTKDGDLKGYPQEFTTESRLIIIVNEWKSLNENVRSLENRGMILRFDPSPRAVHDEIYEGGWFDDQEVYDFMTEHLAFVAKPSFRPYIIGSKLRKANLNWRKSMLEMIAGEGDARLQFIAEAHQSGRYKTVLDMEQAFTKTFAGHKRSSASTFRRLWAEYIRYPRESTADIRHRKLKTKPKRSLAAAR